MRLQLRRNGLLGRTGVALLLVAAWAMTDLGNPGQLAAQPINPQVYKKRLDAAKKDADVVVTAKAIAVVCAAAEGQGKQRSVNLNVALQVLDTEKGSLKKNDVLVISRKVNLPSGPGPGMYGYWGQQKQFPFNPGSQGELALRWNKESNSYDVLAGWVATPQNVQVPTEVGQAAFAGSVPKAP
jgi:hypothetical protein